MIRFLDVRGRAGGVTGVHPLPFREGGWGVRFLRRLRCSLVTFAVQAVSAAFSPIIARNFLAMGESVMVPKEPSWR